VKQAFQALDVAGEAANFAVEGCYAPKEGRPGRAYLAVPYATKAAHVLKYFREKSLGLSFTLVHPID